MTKDEAKQWLNRGWELNEKINKKLESQYNAYNLACNATSSMGGEKVQTSHKNSTEDILARYIDVSREVDKLTDELYEVKGEIWQAVNLLDNKLYKKILKLRFVYFKPWGYIAQKVNRKSNTIRYKTMEQAIDSVSKHIFTNTLLDFTQKHNN